MSEELKPCPFCGEKATPPTKISHTGRAIWAIGCEVFCCGIKRYSKKEVVRDWNNRTPDHIADTSKTPDPLLAECVKMLKTMLAEFESAATSIETYQRIIEPAKELIVRCEERADEA